MSKYTKIKKTKVIYCDLHGSLTAPKNARVEIQINGESWYNKTTDRNHFEFERVFLFLDDGGQPCSQTDKKFKVCLQGSYQYRGSLGYDHEIEKRHGDFPMPYVRLPINYDQIFAKALSSQISV